MTDVLPVPGNAASAPASPSLARWALLAVVTLTVGLAWRWGGSLGLAHLTLYLAALTPGIPVGLALFGPRHAGAWIVGGVLGYALTAVALWLALMARRDIPPLGVMLAAGLVGWTLGRVTRRRLETASWTAPDTAALCCVLLLVPALMARPLSRLGEPDDFGTLRFRAYFTADVLWHVALTSELARQRWPARDPFAAPQPLHYYVPYFTVPAASAATLPGGLEGVLTILRVNALGAGLLLVSSIFFLGWTAVPRAAAIGWATALALIGASAEGAYACYRFVSQGRPLSRLRTVNIDAIANWWFQSPTIDGLPRALWYTPQHGAACALGAVALAMGTAAGSRPSWAVVGTAGLALGLSVLFSPFLGGLFALVYGLGALVTALRANDARLLLRHAAAAVPVTAAVAVTRASGVLEGAAAALVVNVLGLATPRAAIVLGLALGPLLLPAGVGLARLRHMPALDRAAVALATGIVTFFTVSLGAADPLWVGWRAGNLLLVTLPALAAAGLVAIAASRRRLLRQAGVAVVAVAFAVGSVTTAIDWFNAQDVENEWPGPGFKWTLTLSPAQQAAFAWIRRETPARAIVQMDPVVRGRDGWVNIPAFGQRAMAAGLPISLVQQPYHRERSDRVHRLFTTLDAKAAWAEARALRIDFIYLDAADRAAALPGALDKFERSPEFFQAVFAQDDVRVYGVLR